MHFEWLLWTERTCHHIWLPTLGHLERSTSEILSSTKTSFLINLPLLLVSYTAAERHVLLIMRLRTAVTFTNLDSETTLNKND